MNVIDEEIHLPALFCNARKYISNTDITTPTMKETDEIESVAAPGVLHIKAHKSINFPLHPIVFA